MSEYFREALKRKRKRRINWDDLEGEGHVEKDKSVSPGRISDIDAEDENDETGQIAAAKKTEITMQADDLIQKQAQKVLGRKPMSTVKVESDPMEGEMEIEFDARPDVLEKMSDERVIEALKSGRRKPKGLWDKVQMNIARKRK